MDLTTPDHMTTGQGTSETAACPAGESHETPEVTVLFPCLNEAGTIGTCVQLARKAMEEAGIHGEVLVVDNGSSDGSGEQARAAGARVIFEPKQGYGRALRTGMWHARGRFIVFLDGDLTYDPSLVPAFVRALHDGADVVIGNRFQGGIEPGAMPRSHKYFGTPVLTLIARLFFGCRIGDINCGMRGIRRDVLKQLRFRSDGMEFASEMMIHAAHHGLKVVELPIPYHRDRRERPPHLRSFRDGWRHLQLMLHLAPLWAYFVPGGLLGLGGLWAVLAVGCARDRDSGVLPGLAGLLAIQCATQILLLGLTAQDRIAHPRWHERAVFSGTTRWLRRLLLLETGIALSLLIMAGGVFLLALAWWMSERNAPWLRDAFLATAMMFTGTQIFFTCAFLGLFGREAAPPPPEAEFEDPSAHGD
ncbi:MAG TPA: glycosyltransferase family 2 protein [Candidatus Hydrogenedentes bacterium]|nr:glycosyltransferase family 2 protein [Candidatus Hydrogenedentota bacterium]